MSASSPYQLNVPWSIGGAGFMYVGDVGSSSVNFVHPLLVYTSRWHWYSAAFPIGSLSSLAGISKWTRNVETTCPPSTGSLSATILGPPGGTRIARLKRL